MKKNDANLNLSTINDKQLFVSLHDEVERLRQQSMEERKKRRWYVGCMNEVIKAMVETHQISEAPAAADDTKTAEKEHVTTRIRFTDVPVEDKQLPNRFSVRDTIPIG